VPSIFTHLLIAEDALEALPVGRRRRNLEEHRHAYFLGALAPDLPYFNIFSSYRGLPFGPVLGPVTQTLESRVLDWLGWSMPQQAGFALRLHSLGTQRTLQGWSLWAGSRHPALQALVAGMVTHVAADEVLHPKINADSGDEHSVEGLRRHREIEINLDMQLLRGRGVSIEQLQFSGLLESYLGRVDQRGEYLSPALKHLWTEASAACDSNAALKRRDLDAWSRGFARAMVLLDHRLSPLADQRRAFLGKGEEQWRTFFAREGYLGSHVLRATRVAQQRLDATLGDSVPESAGV
jgi:hypothetical protein